jgi:hypothetical protein
MENRPLRMMLIGDLPVSFYTDGSVEILDQNSGIPLTLSREQLECIVNTWRHVALWQKAA